MDCVQELELLSRRARNCGACAQLAATRHSVVLGAGDPRSDLRTVTLRLLPLLHPAAALYAKPNMELLEADFAHIPELLALPLPEVAATRRPVESADAVSAGRSAPIDGAPEGQAATDDEGDPPPVDVQLGLF